MRRRGPAAVILWALAAGAAASAPLSEDEMVKRAARMAMMAHAMGACERHLPKADADRNLALITRWADPSDPELAQLTALFAKWYARGKAETSEWSPAFCASEMQKLSAEAEAAARR